MNMMIRRYPYNLARRPRLDVRRYALRLALLLAAIAAFTLLANLQFSRSAKATDRFPELVDNARTLQQLQQEATQLQTAIKGEKKRWSTHVKWINDLIQRKTYPYLSRLDFLERIMPDGVQVMNLTLSTAPGNALTLTAATTSFPQLLELYHRLSPYHLVINSETHAQGTFQVRLKLEYADETK